MGLQTIPQNHTALVTRFGKYSRTLKSGLCFTIPFFEQIHRIPPEWGNIANKQRMFIELAEQQMNTGARSVVTADNVQVKADAIIYWRIIDPVKAIFDVDVLPVALRETALNALRGQVGKIDLDTLFKARQRLSQSISTALLDVATRWGVQIDRVEIQQLEIENDTAEMMQTEASAERDRRATALEAKGIAESIEVKARAEAEKIRTLAQAEREKQILEADGRAKATKMAAVAEREFLASLAEIVGPEKAAQVLVAEKAIDGYRRMSEGPANKVFIPNNFRSMLYESESGTAPPVTPE